MPSPRQPTRSGPEKSNGVSNSASVITPVLKPPGIAAFARRPFHTPPPNSSISWRHGDPQRRFVAAGPIHVAAQAEQFRAEAAGIARIARLGRRAHRLEPRHAAIDDVLHAGQRLDVIDHGGLAEQPFDGGKRRLDPRPGPLALDALDQARLLAADIGRGAAVDVHVERIAASRGCSWPK